MESVNNTRPQDDFYTYVNKKWLDDPKNKIPDEYSRWGGFIKLHDDGLTNQISLVESLENNPKRTTEEDKIYAIWKASCEVFKKWQDKTSNQDVILND